MSDYNASSQPNSDVDDYMEILENDDLYDDGPTDREIWADNVLGGEKFRLDDYLQLLADDGIHGKSLRQFVESRIRRVNDKWITSPDLFDAVSQVPSEQVMELIEREDWDYLAELVDFIKYLDDFTVPLFTLDELHNLLRTFITYLEKNRYRIIESGTAGVEFMGSLWLSAVAGNLFYISSKDKMLSLVWLGYEEPSYDDSLFIRDNRERILEIKLKIINELCNAISSGASNELFSTCFQLCSESFTKSQFQKLIQLESKYWLPIDRPKAHGTLACGGLRSLFELVGIVVKELSIGTTQAITINCREILHYDKNERRPKCDSYYGFIQNNLEEPVKTAYAACKGLRAEDAKFWEDYWHQFKDSIESMSDVQSSDTSANEQNNSMRFVNETWVIVYEGTPAYIKDSVGAQYIAFLLDNSGKELELSQVMALGKTSPELANESAVKEYLENKNTDSDGSRPVKPKKNEEQKNNEEVERRIERERKKAELSLKRARRANNEDAIQEAQETIAKIAELEKVYFGIDHKPRPVADDVERQRKSVSGAIHRTLRKIEKQGHQTLYAHLFKNLNISHTVSYAPESPVLWDVVRM